MTIRPTRVTTIGRDSNWGFRVLGANSEVLASRWGFTTDEAARQAGIAASLAISSTSITMAQGPSKVNRKLQQAPERKRTLADWF